MGQKHLAQHRMATRSEKVLGIQANEGTFCAILENGDTLLWGTKRQVDSSMARRKAPARLTPFFFPRSCLVVHATWSVIASEKDKAIHFMNLGEARFAGETVRRS